MACVARAGAQRPSERKRSGGEGDRTLYLLHAMQALYQLSYAPVGAATLPGRYVADHACRRFVASAGR